MEDAGCLALYVRIGVGGFALIALALATAWQRRRGLHRSAERGAADRIGELLAKGEDVDARDRRCMTPLHHAALNNQLDAAKALLAAGAHVNAKSKDHLTPLYLAAVNGFPEMVELLLAHDPRETETALDVTSWQVGDLLNRGGELRGQDARVIRALMAYGGHDLPEGDDPEALLAAVKARQASR